MFSSISISVPSKMRSVEAALSDSMLAPSKWRVPPSSMVIFASCSTVMSPVQCNSAPSLMMISPSNEPSVQAADSVMVIVSPCEGGEARTGPAIVMDVSISMARNVAVRMVLPVRRRKSNLLRLVRNIFPANCVANQVE